MKYRRRILINTKYMEDIIDSSNGKEEWIETKIVCDMLNDIENELDKINNSLDKISGLTEIDNIKDDLSAILDKLY